MPSAIPAPFSRSTSPPISAATVAAKPPFSRPPGVPAVLPSSGSFPEPVDDLDQLPNQPKAVALGQPHAHFGNVRPGDDARDGLAVDAARQRPARTVPETAVGGAMAGGLAIGNNALSRYTLLLPGF